jgi:uncharacterized membrane protein YfcA
MPEFSQLLSTVDPQIITVFFLFAAVGFLAQIVDGALGMAYGVISTTVLLAFGVPPATASASVHAAEVFTTGASGISHISHRNVDWKAFAFLAPAGMIGGVAGAYLLTGIDGKLIQPFVVAYLGLIGFYILIRTIRPFPRQPINLKAAPPLGLIGGFLDAVGGGGWGPMVTSSLIGSGAAPRTVIGTVNTAEFFVTCAISAGFVWALLTGHWQDAGGLTDHLPAVAGLIFGGLLAAPLAGFIVKLAPPRVLTAMVGVLVLGLSIWQGVRLWG